MTTPSIMKMTLIAFFVGCSITAQAGACPDNPEWKAQLLEQLNALRASGASCRGGTALAPAAEPMRWSPALEAVAIAHTTWMAEKGELMHVGRGGEGLGERARQAAYLYERVGENVAMGYFRMDHVVDAWRASTRHCNNMMDPRYTEVAVACVRSGNGPWWTITLGRPRDAGNRYARAVPVSSTPQ
jgi:uncharacterized protein YkwD